jgi:transcription-repair coupling factor (superfamily II helicase)
VHLSGVARLLAADPVAAAWESAGARRDVGGGQLVAPEGAVPPMAALLAGVERVPERGPLLVITATVRGAEDTAAALASLLDPSAVALFPAWETLPHERMSPSADIVGQRLSVLRRLAHPDPGRIAADALAVVVAPLRAVLQPIVTGLGEVRPVTIRQGQETSVHRLAADLVAVGYERTDLVSRRGQFAQRGGIVDVFPPTSPHPVRLEFFGDEVDEIRSFAVSDQRSLDLLPDGLWAPVCRELLLTEPVRARAVELVGRYPELSDLLSSIGEGIAVPGMEAFAPVLADGMETIADVLPEASAVLLVEPERLRARAEELVGTSAEFLAASWHNAAAGNAVPIDLGAASYRELSDLRAIADRRGLGWWTIAPFGEGDALDASPVPAYRGEWDPILADIRERVGDRVVLVAAGHGSAQRLSERLQEADIPAELLAEVPTSMTAGVVVTTGELTTGFVDDTARLVVLTEADLFGASAVRAIGARLPSRRRRAVDPLTLQAGDHVVHSQHGVGRYVEMVARTAAGATREYLVIEYAPSKRGQPGDRLYVPTDQLDQVTRYVGGEAPAVHRLGGADWQKAKGRARKAVRQIADQLVKLYAARQQTRGRAFGPDTPWQRELEEAFPFQETPDQQACIDEVKADMAQPVPMDRVICGDVGYGKTEIAVRAAFKAVADGAQVVVLVPTTLLVQQHLQTFRERFAPFPVKVEALSRFQTKAQSEQVLAGLADGTIDVVIGTHRLLGPQTKVKDLGLVIVDEEQRFGVEHKEHLKALRTNVDVLTMSATPIPRTLEMAVTGIREMSTIATPPEDRLPVLTFVGPYDDRQVGAAIRRELARDGQVFFVHNRVESIQRVATRIAGLVPDARIAVAHGQLNEAALEQVIVDFWEKRFDVLISTTIVESGLDIPNANTLIVDRADTFGLSQLHQLRGRVGRGRERAYAYFLYNPDRVLTETAHERLATIAQHTDLGSGMAVAMKDLEIRGAGNLLGGEQSGHIADVGFDLYVRMVSEALAEYKGTAEEEPAEVRIELPLDAHIPHEYIPDERLRLEAYRRLAGAATDADVDEAVAELLDRYGRPPQPVSALVDVARLRNRARAAGITEMVAAGTVVRVVGWDLPESRVMRLQRLYPGTIVKPATRTVILKRPTTARVGGKPLVGADLMSWVGELVDNSVVAG